MKVRAPRDLPFIVDFYEVEISDQAQKSFESVLNSVAKIKEITQRQNNQNGHIFRLQQMSDWNKRYEGELVRIKMDLQPNKASVKAVEIKSVGLLDDEGICAQTAFVYDPALSLLALQRDRFGVSANAFAEYFEQITQLPCPIFLNPILTREAVRRIEKLTIFKKIEIGFANIKSAKSHLGKTQTMNNFFNAAEEFEAPNLNITFSVGRENNTLNKKKISKFVASLRGKVPPKNLSKIRLSGRTPDDDMQVLDILEPRLFYQATIRTDLGRNEIPYEHRIKKLKEAYQSKIGEIKDVLGDG